MIYITYNQLAKDIIAWSEQLPRDIDVFIAVARSGIIPATMLALHRNVRVSTVEEFCDGRIFQGGFRDQKRRLKKVMIVDDSLLSGRSLMSACKKLAWIDSLEILTGVVYQCPRTRQPAEYHYKKVPTPRIFEWNWLHHFWMQQACVDIDGVMCRDPTNEENDDGLRYREFLLTVEPRHIPTVQIHTIVTSRLDIYRLETAKWLEQHDIKYKNLIMHPAGSAIERRKLGDHAERKARLYRNKEYQLFVESSERQAKIIHKKTEKPVLCTDTNEIYSRGVLY